MNIFYHKRHFQAQYKKTRILVIPLIELWKTPYTISYSANVFPAGSLHLLHISKWNKVCSYHRASLKFFEFFFSFLIQCMTGEMRKNQTRTLNEIHKWYMLQPCSINHDRWNALLSNTTTEHLWKCYNWLFSLPQNGSSSPINFNICWLYTSLMQWKRLYKYTRRSLLVYKCLYFVDVQIIFFIYLFLQNVFCFWCLDFFLFFCKIFPLNEISCHCPSTSDRGAEYWIKVEGVFKTILYLYLQSA